MVPLSPHLVKCNTATLGDNYALSPKPFFPWQRMHFKVSPGEMESAMRRMGAVSLVAVCGMLTCAPVRAGHVPPVQGNDTGGIIAYPLATQTDVRLIAVNHCAAYGKVVKFLSVDPQYGGHTFLPCPLVPHCPPPPPPPPLSLTPFYLTPLP